MLLAAFVLCTSDASGPCSALVASSCQQQPWRLLRCNCQLVRAAAVSGGRNDGLPAGPRPNDACLSYSWLATHKQAPVSSFLVKVLTGSLQSPWHVKQMQATAARQLWFEPCRRLGLTICQQAGSSKRQQVTAPGRCCVEGWPAPWGLVL